MQVKLTLRMDEVLIQSVKKRAKKRGKSVSQFIADYIKLLDSANDEIINTLPPITKKLRGILKNSKISEADYYKHLEDKYL